jgi:hypothetical protein
MAIDPGFPYPYVNLATDYQQLERYQEAEAAYRAAAEHKVDIPIY